MQRVTDTSKAVGITKCGSLRSADSKSVPFEYYLPHDTMHRADYDTMHRADYDTMHRAVYDTMHRAVYDTMHRADYDTMHRADYDTMHRADYAVSSLSISLSHASILLKWQNIIQLFSPSGSHTILVIPYQSVW